MWKILLLLSAWIDRRTNDIGKLAAALGVAMIALVATNVALRYSFSFGAVWAQELEWHLLAAMIQLGMAHALLHGGAVRVDLIYQRYGPRTQRAVDAVSALLMVAICALFIALSLGYVAQSFNVSETSSDPGGMAYRWLLKALIPVGFALIIVQQLSELIRTLAPRHLLPPHGETHA